MIIRIEKVDAVMLGRGVIIYFAWDESHPAPVGFAWGQPKGTETKMIFEVYGSFVEPWARRKGVRSKINDSILQGYKAIVTCTGSDEGGRAFLKATGFKLNAATGQWIKTR